MNALLMTALANLLMTALAKLLKHRATRKPAAWAVCRLATRHGSTVSPGCEAVWVRHRAIVEANGGVSTSRPRAACR